MKTNASPEHSEVYAHHAEEYEQLVSHEDYQSNITDALKQSASFENAEIIELGAGTGRLARVLAPSVRSVYAFDASPNMLKVASEKLHSSENRNWGVAAADHRSLPIVDNVADIVIAGWSIVYLVVWHEDTWERELAKGLDEMKRILRSGGSIVILETLGTGHVEPHPPDNLLDYYAFLDQEGFSSTWIRTDYRFQTMEEAEKIVSFFFGEDMIDAVVDDGSITLPECTGIWHLEVET